MPDNYSELPLPIRLERWSSTQDAQGRWNEVVSKYPFFAYVKTGGKGDGKDKGKVSISFRMQFKPNFKPTGNWRVVYDGERYPIGSIKKDREERFWWIFNG